MPSIIIHYRLLLLEMFMLNLMFYINFIYFHNILIYNFTNVALFPNLYQVIFLGYCVEKIMKKIKRRRGF